MTIPKKLTRVTKASQYQFYQPGFNPGNSCWLTGGWVKVSKEVWDATREDHEKLYAGIRDLKQHYRDPSTPIEKMSQAQKQAWEFFSGEIRVECLVNGRVQGISVSMAGKCPKPRDLAWIRKNEYKILRTTQNPNGEVIQQLEGYDFPEDVISEALDEGGKPIDTWARVIEQNRNRQRDFFKGNLSLLQGAVPEGSDLQNFAGMMALQQLIQTEEEIVRGEWYQQTGQRDIYARDEEALAAEYREMRAQLKTSISNFEEAYENSRASHNHYARTNLDSSNGHLFCYVLPKFNEDGSHEPWGSQDVPWNSIREVS
jgi:hypothetical protein